MSVGSLVTLMLYDLTLVTDVACAIKLLNAVIIVSYGVFPINSTTGLVS